MQGGQCQCGDVTFKVRGPLRDVFNCHCLRCRRFTGHHMAATAASTRDVEIESVGSQLRWYSPADDPNVFYGFCANCGSSLFWRTGDNPEHLSICAGTLEQPTGLRTTQVWWTAQSADYHQRQPDLIEYDTE